MPSRLATSASSSHPARTRCGAALATSRSWCGSVISRDRAASTCWRTALVGKARDIPLEQVDLARLLGRDERELLNDEALAHSGQTGHEDAAALARRFDEHFVEV